MTLRLTTYEVPVDAECDACGTRLWGRARLENVAPGVAIFRGDAGLACKCGRMHLTGAISVDPARPAFHVEMPLTVPGCSVEGCMHHVTLTVGDRAYCKAHEPRGQW